MSYYSIVGTYFYEHMLPKSDGYPIVFLAYLDANGAYTLEESDNFVVQAGPAIYILNRNQGLSPKDYPRWNEVQSPYMIPPSIKRLYIK